jgi:hypothetical protein
MIFFLRWGASGGRSFFFFRFFYFSFEKTWMESLGGGGASVILFNLNKTISYVQLVGLGSLLFVSFSFCVYFF